MGEWTPSAAFFQQLTAQEAMDDNRSRPYPFCLAYQLDQEVAQLRHRDDWLVVFGSMSGSVTAAAAAARASAVRYPRASRTRPGPCASCARASS